MTACHDLSRFTPSRGASARCLSLLLVLLGSALPGSSARAAEPTYHATAELGASYNDNILAAPDEIPPDQPNVLPPMEDAVIQYAPGAAIFYETPRIRLEARYSHPFIIFVEHRAVDSSADILTSTGRFLPTRYDELEVELNFARYSTNLSTLQGPDETAIGVQRGANSTMLTWGVAQEYARQLSTSWSLLETGTAGVAVPASGNGGMFGSTLSLGPQLGFEDHAIALLPSLSYTVPLSDQRAAPGFQSQDQLIVGGHLRWHWGFVPPEWSLSATAGAVSAIEGKKTRVEPVGSAAIAYSDRGYGVGLQYDRGFVPNLITAQTYFSDGVSLRGELPIIRDADIRARTTTGFALNRAIDLAREVDTGRVKTFVADVGVGWFPELYPHIELRYQYTRQWDAPPDQIVLPNMSRNVVSLIIRYMFPTASMVRPKGITRKPEENPDNPLNPIGE